jgi:hypothetical protein
MRTFAAIAFSVISLSAVAFQDTTPPDRVVQRVYIGPGAERVEGLGACEVTTTDVSCWDMDGKKSTDLEDQLKAYFLTQTSEVAFKFRKKNRFLAVRKAGNAHVGFTRAGGEHIYRQFSSGDDRPQFLSIAVEPSLTTTSLLLTIPRQNIAPEIDFPFREGKHVVGSFEVSVGKAAPLDPKAMPNRFYNNYGTQGDMTAFKAWTVPLEVVKLDPKDRRQVAISPVDSSKRPIAYVDKKGEIASGVKYLESTRNNPNPMGYPVASKDYAQAYFQPGYPGAGGASLYQTNISPSRIGFLRVKLSLSETVLIEGFPLDPR